MADVMGSTKLVEMSLVHLLLGSSMTICPSTGMVFVGVTVSTMAAEELTVVGLNVTAQDRKVSGSRIT